MKKVYQLALISAISLCGLSFVVSSVEAGKVTQEEILEAKTTFQAIKKASGKAKTSEYAVSKAKFKGLKARYNFEQAEDLLQAKDDNKISAYLSARKEQLNTSFTKAKNRPEKTFKQDKVTKLETELEQIGNALNGDASKRISYVEGRSKSAANRMSKMEKKLANSKK